METDTDKRTIKAIGKLGEHDIEATAVNPGDWFGNTWLIEIGCGYSSIFFAVEAESCQDALDEFADSVYGHHIDIPEEDIGDYDPETVTRAGNDGHPVDLDYCMIHGQEGIGNGKGQPWPCVYRLPQIDVNPTAFADNAGDIRDLLQTETETG